MAEANGNSHAEAETVVEESVAEPIIAPTEPAEEPIRIPKGLYFVRVPRPEFDETQLKKLQHELSEQINKLKDINGKMQVKRGEANALRQQLADARSIRDGSKDDYETKMTRIKELQEMRKSYLDRISDIRSGQKGLEVRSEEDLDAKISELEAEIASGSVPLRVEKQLVANIAKLRSQRGKVQEFQAAQGDLGSLDADLKRVRAMLAELQDEFKIITGERDQVKAIITDLQAKLKVVTDGMSYLDSERAEIEAHKAELQEQLRSAREDIDAAMAEYRENRKLSLQLRDLADGGQLLEAAALAAQQVETYMAKLVGDPVYRKEYVALWCAQRKYLVSELLPKSGVGAPAAPPAVAAKGGKAKPAGPAVPKGAAMAQAAIAAALAAADTELAAARAAAVPSVQVSAPASTDEDDADADAEAAAAVAVAEKQQQRRIVPGAPDELLVSKPTRQHKTVEPAPAPAAPKVEYEFVLPVAAGGKENKEVVSAAELKERVREENKRKAAEAEERKKKRMEAAAKKKARAEEEAARRAEAEAAARTARAHAEAAAKAAAAAEAAVAAARKAAASGTDGEGDGEEGGATITHRASGSKAAGAAAVKPVRPPRLGKAAKKPTPAFQQDPLRWLHVHAMEYNKEIAIAMVVFVCLMCAVLAYLSKA